MRLIWILLFAVLSYASEADLIQSYREGGIEALEKRIDKALQSKEYWNAALEKKDTRFGYYEDLKFLFVATKNAPTLRLFEADKEQWVEKLNTQALVGSNLSSKQKEGDLATPIGVYILDARLTGLDQYYGPLAISTSYPNLFDRLHKRTGSGIWIHGMPLDGNREEVSTRGCIVIENHLLKQVDSLIDRKKSLLITYENNPKETQKSDLAILLADLFQWKEAWRVNNIDKYLGFYSPQEFIRFDGMRFKEFASNKQSIFKKGERKSINFLNINISPYPNDLNKPMFRISFFEDYKAPTYVFKGQKELYVELKDGKMQILAER
ncbi:MAG: L,D-transpeptidase family protein [Helicobacter sp.]|nr:L,D-transpeptidase family protein [Helicobacter sp.]